MGLELVEILLSLEKTFGITIPDADARQAKTVADLQNLCLNHPDLDRARFPPEIVRRIVVKFIAEQAALKPEQVLPHHHLVRDLGLG